MYNKNIHPSMKVHVHWMNLMTTKSYKNFRILKFWKKRCKAKNSFYKPFDEKNMFNAFIMFNFRCRSHVHEILLLKSMFVCPLKQILEFFGIFYISSIKPKYSYTIMYECEKSPLTHELFYIGLLSFFHLSLFHM
jgi:hypothetical protein